MNAARIVLIEDNPGDVLLVERSLKENGVAYELTKFKRGEEALRALCPADGAELEASVPDALLLDLNTPRADGFQVLIALKRSPRLARVPMAVITSSQAPGDNHRTGLLGARYIQKPARLDEFLTTVGQAIKDMLGDG